MLSNNCIIVVTLTRRLRVRHRIKFGGTNVLKTKIEGWRRAN